MMRAISAGVILALFVVLPGVAGATSQHHGLRPLPDGFGPIHGCACAFSNAKDAAAKFDLAPATSPTGLAPLPDGFGPTHGCACAFANAKDAAATFDLAQRRVTNGLQPLPNGYGPIHGG